MKNISEPTVDPPVSRDQSAARQAAALAPEGPRDTRLCVVVPNWNGADDLPIAIDSLLAQSFKEFRLLIIDNGSIDASQEIIEQYKKHDARIDAIYHSTNLGFTGGVNAGIRRALQDGAMYVALFNNDAFADKDWLEQLVKAMQAHPEVGIVACKFLTADGKRFDSTGDILSTWGLPFPRGRDEQVSDRYDKDKWLFGASAGSSLYRVAMLREIGLFDNDFFAYYEDVDISFRAQLAGWKIMLEPNAVAYHHIGMTSGKIKGFTTYQSFKNLPIVLQKNLPKSLGKTIWPRFWLAYTAFFFSAIKRGQATYAMKGIWAYLKLRPKKRRERLAIQASAKVDASYINSLLYHDLPPNQYKLRKLRAWWWKLRGKKS